MREAVLVDMIRTPFGRAGQRGVFRDISHVEMVVPLMKNVLDRNNVGGEEVDEVLWGSVGIAGMLTRSRHYVLEASLPHTISATDMNKQCGSSLQASTQGAFPVMAGNVGRGDRRRRGDDGPGEPDPARRRDEPAVGADGGSDVEGVPAAVAGQGQGTAVAEALVPGDGALDHGHGSDSREAGRRAGRLARGRR